MELHLSRQLAQRRIHPAVDILRSGTRKEELLMDQSKLDKIWKLRKLMSGNALEYTDQLINMLQHTEDNEAFFQQIDKLSS